jgi:hypothetical protein
MGIPKFKSILVVHFKQPRNDLSSCCSRIKITQKSRKGKKKKAVIKVNPSQDPMTATDLATNFSRKTKSRSGFLFGVDME